MSRNTIIVKTPTMIDFLDIIHRHETLDFIKIPTIM
jgi:hypothetical protein